MISLLHFFISVQPKANEKARCQIIIVFVNNTSTTCEKQEQIQGVLSEEECWKFARWPYHG
jgi:hypothetical protein